MHHSVWATLRMLSLVLSLVSAVLFLAANAALLRDVSRRSVVLINTAFSVMAVIAVVALVVILLPVDGRRFDRSFWDVSVAAIGVLFLTATLIMTVSLRARDRSRVHPNHPSR